MKSEIRYPSFTATVLFPDNMEGYSEDWVLRILAPKLQDWKTGSLGLKLVVTQRSHLLVLRLSLSDPHSFQAQLLDLVDLSTLDLSQDPRACPAKIGDWVFSSKRNTTWHTVVLLCAFDTVLRSTKIMTGTYEIWPGLKCKVKVDKKKKTIALEALSGVPLTVEEGLV